MAINFPYGFVVTSTESIDSRFVMTPQEMKEAGVRMPDYYLTICSEGADTGKIFIYDKDMVPDPVYGNFRPARLADFTGDIMHRTVTDEQIARWESHEANVQADWDEQDPNADSYIKNKPDLARLLRYKGSVDNYSDLPTENLSIGDMYNIRYADPTHSINAGDNVACAEIEPAIVWDNMGGLVNLENYYTKDDVDGLLAGKQDVGDYATRTELTQGLAGKQNTLIAGANITIENDVISATGGSGGDYTAGDGISIDQANRIITNTAIPDVNKAYVDAQIADVTQELAGKQDVLTAGANITIENNVISAMGGSKVFTGLVVHSTDWVIDSTYTRYGYRAAIPLNGVTANDVADVVFGIDEVTSGHYAPLCNTYEGGVYVYSSAHTDTTIPTIIVFKG